MVSRPAPTQQRRRACARPHTLRIRRWRMTMDHERRQQHCRWSRGRTVLTSAGRVTQTAVERYELPDGTKFGIITEADRSATTFLLAEEYYDRAAISALISSRRTWKVSAMTSSALSRSAGFFASRTSFASNSSANSVRRWTSVDQPSAFPTLRVIRERSPVVRPLRRPGAKVGQLEPECSLRSLAWPRCGACLGRPLR